MVSPRQALVRLQGAAASGELRAVCARFGASLLVVFGSVLRPVGDPHDIDIAVRFGTDDPDVLGFLDEVSTVAGTSDIDLMNLGQAGPVARERALVGGVPLVEGTPGLFARMQLAAIMERMDTAWLRRLDLELMTR